MKRKGSAMGSSKYEFEPEEFEKDVQNKIEVAKQFETDLKNVIYGDYRYRDNVPLSYKARLATVLRVHKRLYEEVEG